MVRPTSLDPLRLAAALTFTAERAGEIAARLGVSRATVHRKLQPLLDEELVVRTGEGPGAGYRRPTPAEELAKARSASASNAPVQLTIDARTAGQLQNALELYARIGIGQLGEIVSKARFEEFRRADGSPVPPQDLEEAESLVQSLKSVMLGMASNTSFSIFSPHVNPRVLHVWAMTRALRHRLAWDRRPEGSIGVWHDEPMRDGLIAGYTVTSTADGPEGSDFRYTVEMPVDCAALTREALELYVALSAGNLQPLVDFARDAILRNMSGALVPEEDIEVGRQIAAKIGQVLSGVAGPYNAVLGADAVRSLLVAKALAAHASTGELAQSVLPDGSSATVSKVTVSPLAFTAAELPEGMMLNFRNGQYRIIGPSEDGQHLAIIAESHSIQTAIQMAKNKSTGKRARNTSF